MNMRHRGYSGFKGCGARRFCLLGLCQTRQGRVTADNVGNVLPDPGG
ncbi:hypothetical protein LGZ99_03590 [Photorhabdus temperata]|nr:hypothetical protein [Photorhabdus temperata]MCT8346317.1 hypothetical protein [Photorhabdus temperata]